MRTIIRQIGISSRESTLASVHAMMNRIPMVNTRIEHLYLHKDILREAGTLPIGSVEFMRTAMKLTNICEPDNLSYPEALHPFLHRKMQQVPAGSVLGTCFVKPVTTKRFTGFVFDPMQDPSLLSAHDQEQHQAFLSMNPAEMVWIGEPVVFMSEYRFYITEGRLLGEGRYDDGPEDAPKPDLQQVTQMISTMTQTNKAPAAYSLDIGVLATGETALVECNDAWAIGYYTGSVSREDFLEMLWTRWHQLLTVPRQPILSSSNTQS